MLRTEMRGGGIAVQGGGVGDAAAWGAIAESGSAAIIKTGTATDLVGVPGGRGGIEFSGRDRHGVYGVGAGVYGGQV
jgi:hypothetical protein